MKLTSPHFPTVIDPTIVDVGRAIDEVARRRRADIDLKDCVVVLESTDESGAFAEAIAVGAEPMWMVEVCNADEASLRGLREATTRGRAVELLGKFVQGDRSMGNGAEWLDVDQASIRSRKKSPLSLVVFGLFAAMALGVVVWWIRRTG